MKPECANWTSGPGRWTDKDQPRKSCRKQGRFPGEGGCEAGAAARFQLGEEEPRRILEEVGYTKPEVQAGVQVQQACGSVHEGSAMI